MTSDFEHRMRATDAACSVETCRCFAYVADTPAATPSDALDAAYCARAHTIPKYMAMNTEVAALSAERATWGPIAGLKRRDQSVVPDDVVAEEKVAIKGTIVGPGCTIGARSKLNNCVVEAGVKIGPNCVIQNTVICAGAVIEAGCSLNDCQVGASFKVPGATKAKGESFAGGGEAADGEGAFW